MAGKKYIDMKDSDVVEYFLFPDLSVSSRSNEVNLHAVEEVMDSINKIVNRLSEDYIWHNDEFQISHGNLVSYMNSNGNETEPFRFHGSLNYAENIEDEWFLVYLLIELTKQIQGLLIKVKDSDGDFLLIEAAEVLPSWVTPETCEDKVFLYNGQLHILPQSFSSNQKEFTITEEVIKYIRQHSKETKASKLVQQVIKKRISGYPEKMNANFHNSILYVPVGVASLLNTQPKFIAPAVRAFCERDLVDVKACRAMKFFPPENRVLTQVKFTRCLYAMLMSSKYLPDRRTGWNLPSPNEESYKSHILGIKAACGFEILMSQARSKIEKEEDEPEAVDFNNDPNWKKFFKSLSSKNYFKGLLERSKEYDQLLDAAKEFYKTSCDKMSKPNKAKEIADTMDKLEIDVEELRKKERNLPKSDDDSWMNITPQDLDAMLEARFGSAGQDLELANGNADVSQHLKTFINHVSGIEGAEFPKKESKATPPVRPKRGVKNKKRKSVKFSPDTKLHSASSIDKLPSANANRIQFEPDGFINAIQNILDFKIPDDNYWESEGSGMSSYEDETDMDLGEATKPATDKKDADLMQYMDQMDEELSKTTIAKSFVRKKTMENEKATEDSFDDIETFKPVDIDLNALKNILSSYQAQMGEPGPAENLLGPLGLNLDDIDADID